MICDGTVDFIFYPYSFFTCIYLFLLSPYFIFILSLPVSIVSLPIFYLYSFFTCIYSFSPHILSLFFSQPVTIFSLPILLLLPVSSSFFITPSRLTIPFLHFLFPFTVPLSLFYSLYSSFYYSFFIPSLRLSIPSLHFLLPIAVLFIIALLFISLFHILLPRLFLLLSYPYS